MTAPATYERQGNIARITLDDGKLNVMSSSMIAAVNAALDQAETDGVAVVLAARGKVFSAGFDLKVFRDGNARQIYDMRRSGAEMVLRIYGFPRPVVAACHATAFPMGAFPVLACDFRYGVTGDHRIGMNETAIGLVLPRWNIELTRTRLNPAYFNRAMMTGEMFTHEEALAAGFFDRVVEPDDLDTSAMETAQKLAGYDAEVFAATKRNVRGAFLEQARQMVEEDITLAAAEERVARRDAAR